MIRTILILKTIFFLHAYTAGAQTLPGTWQVDWEETLTHASPAEVSRFESYDAGMKQQVRSGMEGRRYAFTDNGEVTLMSGVRTVQGTWALEGSVLKITMGNLIRSYQLDFTDTDTMTMELIDAPSTILFSKAVLKRVS